jgi:hypothetical protein
MKTQQLSATAQALVHRALCNREASRGNYQASMEQI